MFDGSHEVVFELEKKLYGMEILVSEDMTCAALSIKTEPKLAAADTFALTVLIPGKVPLRIPFGSRDHNAGGPVPMLETEL